MSESVTANDLTIYERHAHEWWMPESYYFRSLQSITPLRLALISQWMGSLRGKKVLDLGCGGGLLAVPLSLQGAQIVGVDLSPKSLKIASQRAHHSASFVCTDLMHWPFAPEMADAAILADIVDHLRQYAELLRRVSGSLRPGGKIFISTINRTFRSRLLAITLGEGLGFIPRGTHDHKLFIRPEELIKAATQAGFRCLGMQGETLQLLKTLRTWTVSLARGRDTSVAYSAVFEKE